MTLATAANPTQQTLAARFNAMVVKPRDGSSACWIWIGSISHDGCGVFDFYGEMTLAHEISWYIASRIWPSGPVHRRCNNPLCVRPTHLVLEEP